MSSTEHLGYGTPPRFVVHPGWRGTESPPVTGLQSQLKWNLARRSLAWPARLRQVFWQALPADVAAAHSRTLEQAHAGEGVSIVSSWDDDRSLVVIPSEPRLGVAKVSLTEESRKRLRDEYAALSAIAAAEQVDYMEPCVPKILNYDDGVLWTERLAALRRQPSSVPAAVLESLTRLAPRVEAADGLAESTCPACRRLARESTGTSLWHGDLTPWNLMARGRANQLVIIDWELAWPFALVPTELLTSAWEIRVRAAKRRSNTVTDDWGVAAVCFDRYRKQLLAKRDGWADRVAVVGAVAGEHRYV